MKIMEILKQKSPISKDEIAELLKISPEALIAFESAYEKKALNQEEEDFFSVNARQAVKANRNELEQDDFCSEHIEDFVNSIVQELLSETLIISFDGNNLKSKKMSALPEDFKPITNHEIKSLPEKHRPQLTGALMMRDIDEHSYIMLLDQYKSYLQERDIGKKKHFYHLFRQGLDILDLDPVTYEIIGTNPNSMGNWLPSLVKACKGTDFFKIPATTIVKVPMTLLQLTRLEYTSLTRTTLNIVDKWAYEAFGLNENKEYFLKTGTYSSKYDFRNCYIHEPCEVRELGEYLLFIHFQALQMASPLCSPCIYGVSTTNEWVVRDFIPDKEDNPTIYKGLPLHTEYRVFIDCDSKKVIGISPYWEPETMKKRFGHSNDSNSPHHIHDYIIFKTHEKTLMQRYHDNKDLVVAQIEKILPDLELKGQWSLDVMQNGDEFWLIDMAVAENSAFYECVPEQLRNPSIEDWIPKITKRD